MSDTELEQLRAKVARVEALADEPIGWLLDRGVEAIYRANLIFALADPAPAMNGECKCESAATVPLPGCGNRVLADCEAKRRIVELDSDGRSGDGK